MPPILTHQSSSEEDTTDIRDNPENKTDNVLEWKMSASPKQEYFDQEKGNYLYTNEDSFSVANQSGGAGSLMQQMDQMKETDGAKKSMRMFSLGVEQIGMQKSIIEELELEVEQ